MCRISLEYRSNIARISLEIRSRNSREKLEKSSRHANFGADFWRCFTTCGARMPYNRLTVPLHRVKEQDPISGPKEPRCQGFKAHGQIGQHLSNCIKV